jgi:hypothetical protein
MFNDRLKGLLILGIIAAVAAGGILALAWPGAEPCDPYEFDYSTSEACPDSGGRETGSMFFTVVAMLALAGGQLAVVGYGVKWGMIAAREHVGSWT